MLQCCVRFHVFQKYIELVRHKERERERVEERRLTGERESERSTFE